MQITEANASSAFKQKPKQIQELINQALYILHALGVPLKNVSGRRLERIAMVFLAVADVTSVKEWSNLKDATSNRSLRTRDIISYVNRNFNEDISMGSYDDIRRKDLLFPVAAGIIIQTSPNSARNNSMRGYAINQEFAEIIRTFRAGDWHEPKQFMENRSRLAVKLDSLRVIPKTTVTLPSGVVVQFSPGEHNVLQKAIIEAFLPRYGYHAQVLYVGDTSNKFLVFEQEILEKLQFFELSHGELPDIIAYSEQKNWLYLIEAFFSSGPITPMRRLKLEELTRFCSAEIIYVTAFLTKEAFRSQITNIAWETEVWIATDPDHLIHFNGGKFLGPYT